MTARAIRCPSCGFLILASEGCPSCNPLPPARGRKYKREGIESPEGIDGSSELKTREGAKVGRPSDESSVAVSESAPDREQMKLF
jgi:hypothetical protein